MQVRDSPLYRDRFANMFGTLTTELRLIAEEWEDPLFPNIPITERRDALEFIFPKKMADEMYLTIEYLQQLFKPEGFSYRRDFSIDPNKTT